MVNRGWVGAVFARGRAPIVFALLVLGGGLLLRHDAAGPPHSVNATLSSPAQIRAAFGRLPLSFELNQGQSDSRVKFLARGNGYGLFLTPAEAALTLPDTSKSAAGVSVVEMRLSGANQNTEIAGSDRLPGHSSYFIGNDPSRWHRNIPQFARVHYREVYPGIDLAFYGKQGRLEYDFEVSPGSDPRQIKLDFKGTESLKVAADGALVLTMGDRELRFEAPHIYQTSAAGDQAVSGSFILLGANRAGFEVGNYDRSRILVIDPVFTFSTFLGGSGDESCTAIIGATAGFVPHCPAIAVDSASRVYVAGATTSPGSSFPLPPGTTTPPTLDGGADAFLVRFDSTGTALEYTTYLGGSGTEYPTGIGVDGGFNVYVAGTTNSADFPTVNAFQSTPSAAGNHVFVSKFDSSGSANLYSTYVSGTGVDTASGLAVDSLGRAYVFGTTTSTNCPPTSGLICFPTTPGALQPAALATNQFFFSKLDPALSGMNSLLFSTFAGGSTPSNGTVTGGAVAVDNNFNVYLAGGTDFTDMVPGTWIVNAFHSSPGGGLDAWIAKLQPATGNSQLYTPVYGTYLGGSGNDVAYGIATDGTNAYITGSADTGITLVPAQVTGDEFPAANAGGSDAFIAKFGVPVTTGTTQGAVPLSYFTYLGGSGSDAGLAIAVDSNQNARVTGFTNGGFPNNNPLPGSSGGGEDAFFARIVTTGASLANSNSTSILGGSGADIGTSIAVDAALNTYVAGETSSGNFPTSNALQATSLGLPDAFVSKLGPDTSKLSFTCITSTGTGCPSPVPTNPTVSPTPVGVGSQVTFKYSIYNTGDPVAGVLFTDTLGPKLTLVSAAASVGSCPTSAVSGILVCNLGTIPTSVITTSGSTSTTAPAATVTVVVTPTVPTSTGCKNMTQFPINNIGALSAGPGPNAPGSATVNDFCVIASPATATVLAGVPATYSVTATATGSGFPESVSLACGSGLPSGGSCTFTNNPIPNMSNGAQSRALEITTQPRVTTPGSLFRPGPTYAVWLPIFGVGLVGAGISRKRRVLLGIFFAVVLSVALLQAGCGSSKSSTSTTTGTPAGTYTITVNATSGSATRTTTVQLTVQ